MATAGSKAYYISFTLPDGSRRRERVKGFEDEKRLLREYREEYGSPVTLKGRTYGRSASKTKSNPGVTLRNMASVTIKRLPGGAVAVTGRKLGGRSNPGRRGNGYVIYPSSKGVSSLAEARKIAARESRQSENRYTARVESVDSQKTVAVYRDGRKEK